MMHIMSVMMMMLVMLMLTFTTMMRVKQCTRDCIMMNDIAHDV